MTQPRPGGRAALRRARRRRQVRLTALVVGVLLLLATVFAVWLAVDAQGPVQPAGTAAPAGDHHPWPSGDRARPAGG